MFLFRLNPQIPLRRSTGPAGKTLCGQRLFQRNTGIQTALASRNEGNEIDVDMGRGFIHVKVCGKHMQIWVAFLKALKILIQGNLGLLSDLRSRARIIFVSDLDHQLMKGLLLFAGTDLFILVFDLPVCACLFGIVPFQSFIEQLMIYLFDRLITLDLTSRKYGQRCRPRS